MESEAETSWDKEIDATGLVERIRTARELAEQDSPKKGWPPIYIPPGKENTVRGKLAERINAARARMARYEADSNAER
jgi:hypothetical protein